MLHKTETQINIRNGQTQLNAKRHEKNLKKKTKFKSVGVVSCWYLPFYVHHPMDRLD